VRTALAVEGLKLRRATVARVAAITLVVVAPAMGAGFLAAARADLDGPLAAKIAPMLQGVGWDGLMGFVGQILSIGVLLAVGIVTAWSYGREFTDGTFGALFALPTPRRHIAAAKALTILHWGVEVALATVALTLVLGAATGLGMPDEAAWSGAGKTLVIAVLNLALAMPLGLVASALRGYLPGIAALLGIVVVTQVLSITGVGAWFPYAAPGMWSGMGGAELASTVTPTQLLLAVPVGVAGVLGAVWWWDRAHVV
jgi:ABC-2 type transport system permease protein